MIFFFAFLLTEESRDPRLPSSKTRLPRVGFCEAVFAVWSGDGHLMSPALDGCPDQLVSGLMSIWLVICHAYEILPLSQ